MTRVQGPLNVDGEEMDVHDTVQVGAFSIALADVEAFMDNVHPSGAACFRELRDSDAFDEDEFFRSTATFLCSTINGIYQCVAERGEGNQAIHDDAPPTTPRDLVQMTSAQFASMVSVQSTRLRFSKDAEYCAKVEDEFFKLKTEYENSAAFKHEIDDIPSDASFKTSWSTPSLRGRFLALKEFAGGLACPYPTTASVESDFSILRWEADDGRTCLRDISIEGILHCKMFQALRDVVTCRK